jgi:hypothetical protein
MLRVLTQQDELLAEGSGDGSISSPKKVNVNGFKCESEGVRTRKAFLLGPVPTLQAHMDAQLHQSALECLHNGSRRLNAGKCEYRRIICSFSEP